MTTTTIRSIPEHVYKIVPSVPPSPLPHTLPLSELDQTDGFIHLSNAAQIPKTAALFFSSQNTLWLLKVSTKVALAEKGRFKWLDEGITGCIHLYGEKDGEFARLGDGIVVDVEEWGKREGASWADDEVTKEIRERWLKD